MLRTKKKILVFPCGSEIGLEIHRSIQYSTHFTLIGASSVDDHGRFVYENYIDCLPLHDDPKFSSSLKKVIRELGIDAIYPTMDSVAETIHNLAEELQVIVIGSNKETSKICADKLKTYSVLRDHIPLPNIYSDIKQIKRFPIFVKPARGYGARETAKVNNLSQLSIILESYNKTMVIQEYLPGPEWTIDCFSDRHGKLRFHGIRIRERVSNGISVNTSECNHHAEEFSKWAEVINDILKPRGAWFFQAKADSDNKPRLLEVASRIAGSSALFRMKGVNLSLLSCFDAFGTDVQIHRNNLHVELDRALCNRYRINFYYTHIYVDLDDCIIINKKVNHPLVGFLYKSINEGKHITLLTRHKGNLNETLNKYRLKNIFDDIIHITNGASKSEFITTKNALFIDDSFSERASVYKDTKILALANQPEDWL